MPSANKGKGKGREARPSRSRNTTPNSSFSAGPTASAPLHSYLDNDVSKLMMTGSTIQYGELLERMGGVGPIPDSKSLELLMEHLKTLSQLAETRGDACNAGIRELSQKRKEVVEEQESAEREGADRVKMKREADDEEEEKVLKGGKLKRRKERGSSSKEERPLTHGAHDVARQDGAETKVEGGESIIRRFAMKRCYLSLYILPIHSCHANSCSRITSFQKVQERCFRRGIIFIPPIAKVPPASCR